MLPPTSRGLSGQSGGRCHTSAGRCSSRYMRPRRALHRSSAPPRPHRLLRPAAPRRPADDSHATGENRSASLRRVHPNRCAWHRLPDAMRRPPHAIRQSGSARSRRDSTDARRRSSAMRLSRPPSALAQLLQRPTIQCGADLSPLGSPVHVQHLLDLRRVHVLARDKSGDKVHHSCRRYSTCAPAMFYDESRRLVAHRKGVLSHE